MSKSEIKLGVVLGLLIVLAAMSRLVDHPWNFTPMTAILLISAAYISNNWMKIAVPFAIILFSDIVLEMTTGWGFHDGTTSVYFGYFIIFIIGFFLLKKVSVLKIAGASILGSLTFFLITNFAFLYTPSVVPNPLQGTYPHNMIGILASYEAGLPFFKNMLFGDLTFSAILFAAYYLVQNFGLKMTKAKA
ncbi:hypothetical protein EGI22_18965 [Lacihabitans sp. LS3-19]|uniref:DUF6580 family putative transport protein n=1 Tax=Lacihabitans sp. LS3-19 TaxID=2487335 RepID=UPI0020CBCD78|nr:DUF6580 family putative transport protein [Lacihabitans sp. LS3-19]MCP9769990.1 hypothetical protein [Lacihabitans sp. LS3-19]